MEEISLRAYAKVNLGLDVIKKRTDNYHEVNMIMQSVSLYDEVTISKSEFNDINISTNCTDLSIKEDNLVYKAAKLILEYSNMNVGLNIKLIKNIPIAAGLAGGSSDAAATLIGINKLLKLGLSMEELMKIAVKIGADVVFCLVGGTCLAQGIGEKLTRLKAVPDCYIVLVKPNISVSTKFVYENLNVNSLPAGSHPNIDMILEGIEKSDLRLISKNIENILETVTIKKYPVINDIKEKMLELGALKSVMSGSGATVLGIFENLEGANVCMNYFNANRQLSEKFLVEKTIITHIQHGLI